MIFDFFKKKQPKKKSKPVISRPLPKTEPKPATLPTCEKKDIPSKPESKPLPVMRKFPEKEFLKIFNQLTYRHRPWDIWKDFITMFACALSNPVDKTHYDEREALYLKTITKYDKQEQLLFPELVAETVLALGHTLEQDFLGHIFMSLNLGNDAGGQFFTPYHICDFIAEITLDDILSRVEKEGYITINDPCCGAGATLIAGANVARRRLEKAGLNFQNHVLFAAQDIDYVTALMCYIQLSLLGVAGYIKVGNSLTDPMCEGDSLENYWFTPMYFSEVWVTRRLILKMREAKNG